MACQTPFYVKTIKVVGKHELPVPCGKCPDCRKRRISGWSFRLLKESHRSLSAHFITLTYSTTAVPITSKGFMNLCKRDVQLFMKRLRKISPSTHSIKYYLCGEYGGKTFRPHYHAIIFNADIKNIEASWQNGSIHYGTVNGASVGYTLKYMFKLGRIPLHQNDDRQPEFSLMSKGLGANYLTPQMLDYHKTDLLKNMNCVLPDGKKIAMPRYYKDKVYTEIERWYISKYSPFAIEKNEQKKEAAGIKEYGVQWNAIKADRLLHRFKMMKHDNEKTRNKI